MITSTACHRKIFECLIPRETERESVEEREMKRIKWKNNNIKHGCVGKAKRDER